MDESIKIVNLGPIKEIEIAQIKPFMVLVGESGSGKSTVMKVLSLFRWIYKRVNLRSYLRHSQAKDLKDLTFNMKDLLKFSGIDEYVKENTEIYYEMTDAGYLILRKDWSLLERLFHKTSCH